MKIAAAKALAELAREDVPDEVAAAYQGARPKFGPDYIIPAPFDPRLISAIPVAVAKAAMDSGVARKPIVDIDAYAQRAFGAPRPDRRRRCSASTTACARQPKRVVFAEGEEEQVIRAAVAYRQPAARHRHPGRPRRRRQARPPGTPASTSTRKASRSSTRACRAATAIYTDYLYERLQRKGYLFRDCQRLVNNDRNHFAACMVALGDADAHGHRRHPQLFDRARRRPPRHRRQARPPRHRRVDRAGARPHRAGRRHRRARHAERRADSPTSPRRPPASPAASATSRASPCSPIRPSAIRRASAPSACARRCASSTSARVDFEYDGEMAADVALNRARDGALSVLPPVRPGQRADHAGVPLGLDLDQDAAGTRRLDGDRPAAGRPRTSRCRSSRSAPRTPTSSTWRRSRPIRRGLDERSA